MAALALQAAKKLIESYRSQNLLRDMFGENEGTVAVTTVNGADIYGSNSRSPTYTAVDRAAAVDIRDTLIAKYPDLMRADNLGAAPNNALFHAEATVLIRAARANGGTLEGRVLEVFADRPMCRSCEAVLPLLVRELGNPRITFVGPGGQIRVIRNGRWVE